MFSLNGANLQVAQSGVYNYFNYNAAGVAQAAQATTFKYMWDFNGDGMYDTNQMTESAINDVYAIYEGMQQIKLLVKDDVCQQQKSVIVSRDLDVPMEDGVVVAGSSPLPSKSAASGELYTGYQFIQGVVTGKNGLAYPEVNTNFIVSQQMTEAPEALKMYCDPRSGALRVYGLQKYDDYGRDDKYNHGIELRISNIGNAGTESVGIGNGGNPMYIVDTSSASLYQASYFTDEDSDARARSIYTANSGCQLELYMTTTIAQGRCDDGTPIESNMYEMWGAYSCPNMAFEGRAISIADGEFYCTALDTDPCPGGGGGGPPIPEQDLAPTFLGDDYEKVRQWKHNRKIDNSGEPQHRMPR